jgi:hypothetical protein
MPVPFCIVAALGGIAIERALSRGRHETVQVEFLIYVLAGGFLVSCALLERYTTPSPPSVTAITPYRFAVLAVACGLAAAVVAYHMLPRLFWRLAGALTLVIAGAMIFWIVGAFDGSRTEQFFVFRLGASILVLSIIAAGAVARKAYGQFSWAADGAVTRKVFLALLVLLAAITLIPLDHPVLSPPSQSQTLAIAAAGLMRLVVVSIIVLALILPPHTQRRAGSVFLLIFATLLIEQVPNQLVHDHLIINPFYSELNPYVHMREARGTDIVPETPDLKNYRINHPVTAGRARIDEVLYGTTNEVCSDVNTIYGIRSYTGQINLIPVRYLQFLLNWHHALPGGFCVYGDAEDNRFLDLVGAKYDYDRASQTLVRRTGALARFMLFSSYEVKTGDATLERLKAADFDPRKSVILETEPTFAFDPQTGTARPLAYNEIDSDHLSLATDSQEPGILLFDDTYHDGWRAEIDGIPTKLLHANFDFMAIAVPSGHHRIIFSFGPYIFRQGLYAAAAGGGLFVVVLISLVVFARGPVRIDPRRSRQRNWRKYRAALSAVGLLAALCIVQAVRQERLSQCSPSNGASCQATSR